jgi:hypothetical protein
LFLAIIGIACFFVADARAHALLYPPIEDFDGDGWSRTSDGVMTIESNQGWWNAIKHGFTVDVNKLVVGKDLTEFRIYSSPYDVPNPNFLNEYDIDDYFVFQWSTNIHPDEIEVETGNPVFQVIDGLLINDATGELVLSETGLEEVIIPEGVKSITYSAFSDRYIKSVQFPSSLERIGAFAFDNCVMLSKIELPQSLVKLESGAFSGCFHLYEVTLPNRLEKIEPYTFSQCAISYIRIPDNVKKIDEWAFYECDNLSQVVLPQGIEVIGRSAFSGCRRLSHINFPEGLEFIERSAFSGCDHLRYVVLPNTLKWIGNHAFVGCELSILKLPDKLEFVLYGEKSNTYKANPHATRDKRFALSSVDTVIFTGSDYDFGYHAITDAKHVYFLSTPPEEVGEFLDKETVEHIYCSDEFAFQWTRSKVASWVRQKLTILPAAELHALVEEKLSATPTPLETPAPTASPTPSETPIPTRKATPAPTATPTIEQDETDVDPLLIVFAGVLALVVAGIVIVSLKSGKHKRKRKKT